MFDRELLNKSIEEYGIKLSEEQLGRYEKYFLLLKEWNERINLTAIKNDDEIIIKHFSDSMSVDPYIKQYILEKELRGDLDKTSLIDVGTGAGFPGIPLKIANPDISLTLLDSLEKRIKFLNIVMENTHLKDYICIHKRAEDLGRDKSYREKFDICTARAVAKLPVLLEYCMPFVKTGGIFIAMKGLDNGEIRGAKNALDVFGGEIDFIKQFELFAKSGSRTLIIIKKIRQISTVYPRNSSKILKNPL